MKRTKLDKIADIISAIVTSVTLFSVISLWDRLPPKIAFMDGSGDLDYIHKGSFIGMCFVGTMFNLVCAIASRFPRQMLLPGITRFVNDRNREVQLKLIRKFNNLGRIQMGLVLNGVIIGDIAVTLHKIQPFYIWLFAEILTISFLVTWGIYVCRVYQHQ